MLQRAALASHQAGYPKTASKAIDSLIGPQIEATKIKDRLDYQRRAQRRFWVAAGALKRKKRKEKMNSRSRLGTRDFTMKFFVLLDVIF